MRLLARLRRRPPPPARLDPADPRLEVCVTAHDPARADSDVLAEARERGIDLATPLLVRHHLVALPDAEAAEAARIQLATDGWEVVPGLPSARPLALLACRAEVLTALSASRERSRMAGLAQRMGGDVDGWDALRRAPEGPLT